MPLDRTWYNTLQDDSGPGTDGTIWNKAAVDALMDAVDASLPVTGTWTPVIGGVTSESGQTYSSQIGHYVKSGTLVVATCSVTLSAKGTITGSVVIKGLPFPNATGTFGLMDVGYFAAMTTSVVRLSGFVQSTESAARLYLLTAAATSMTAAATGDISNTTSFLASICYHTT